MGCSFRETTRFVFCRTFEADLPGKQGGTRPKATVMLIGFDSSTSLFYKSLLPTNSSESQSVYRKSMDPRSTTDSWSVSAPSMAFALAP